MENDENLKRWPRHSFQLQDYYHLLAESNIQLYEDRSPYQVAEAGWKSLGRAQLLRIQLVKLEALHLRARAALREGLLEVARKRAWQILRAKAGWAAPGAHLVLAGIAAQEGKQKEAVDLLTLCRDEALENGMHHYSMIANWQLGKLIGGVEGEKLVHEAETWAHGQDIHNWPALVRMYAPGT
jgi:hypothetical protein